MRKRVFLLLLTVLPAMLLFACRAQQETIEYEAEHAHIYGYWYDAVSEDCTVQRLQVRYCKLCHAEQTQTLPPHSEHTYCDTVFPPSETQAGYVERRCEVCGHTERLGFER